MRHGHAGVVLPICKAGDRSDGHFGNQFADEHYAAAASATNVETEVYFLEGLMKRNCAAEYARFVELEADEARVSEAFVRIEFCAGWDEWLQERRFHGIVQHEQVLPFGGEEGALLSQWVHILLIALLVIELRELFAPDQVRTS